MCVYVSIGGGGSAGGAASAAGVGDKASEPHQTPQLMDTPSSAELAVSLAG